MVTGQIQKIRKALACSKNLFTLRMIKMFLIKVNTNAMNSFLLFT